MQTNGIKHKTPNRYYSIRISTVSNNRNITKENVKFVSTQVLVFPGEGVWETYNHKTQWRGKEIAVKTNRQKVNISTR